ncbi:hypothetical protein B0I72DRAFT_142678 [Yarrowia lipolytica]|jgi:hypothetical protein|uniref:Uncharacterized protein n=1 Tax=Yarrowia lipolytica TaxID=4952 RepID=Q6H9P0_YARLL|nr:hypothetical protein YALI1_A08821g [Yarrowia lipolytica]KAB8279919.1 hypothetical protein BKA91DRAFT_142802 [Yarrowia lipolytica]KAE8168818.1 hypothetical protein BKA90DRAFT_143640 [Yarrowia lipolytica]KAJ8051501.1 hypothetical protein LXG23DRAFT_51076 [Yarrowia lipolytica]RDW23351.1 hypothetical protein B0I71DRAFT_136093 [Yarrowia lipolytica]
MACYTATVQVPVPIVRVEQSNTSCLKVATFLDPPLVGKFMGTPAVPGPSPSPSYNHSHTTHTVYHSHTKDTWLVSCGDPWACMHATKTRQSHNKPEQARTSHNKTASLMLARGVRDLGARSHIRDVGGVEAWLASRRGPTISAICQNQLPRSASSVWGNFSSPPSRLSLDLARQKKQTSFRYSRPRSRTLDTLRCCYS